MLLNDFVSQAVRRPDNQSALRQFATDSLRSTEAGRLYFHTTTGRYVALFSETTRTRQIPMVDYVFVPAEVHPEDDKAPDALFARIEEDTVIAVMAAASPEALSGLMEYTPQ